MCWVGRAVRDGMGWDGMGWVTARYLSDWLLITYQYEWVVVIGGMYVLYGVCAVRIAGSGSDAGSRFQDGDGKCDWDGDVTGTGRLHIACITLKSMVGGWVEYGGLGLG